MKNILFEAAMYGIRMPIRSLVIIVKDKLNLVEAIKKSVDLTRKEIEIVYHFEKTEAA